MERITRGFTFASSESIMAACGAAAVATDRVAYSRSTEESKVYT